MIFVFTHRGGQYPRSIIWKAPCVGRCLPGRIGHLRPSGSYVQVPEPHVHGPELRMRACGMCLRSITLQVRSDRMQAPDHAVRLRMRTAHPPRTDAHVHACGLRPLNSMLRPQLA